MSVHLKKTLIWWREVPVDVEWGLLDFLAENWMGDIYVVASHDFEAARNMCDWDKHMGNRVRVLIEETPQTPAININDLYKCDAVHLFSGVRGAHERHLKAVKKQRHKHAVCMLIAEAPSLFGAAYVVNLKRVLYQVMYRYYHLNYEKIFDVFFTLGRSTEQIYANYGWDRSKMFPFMYLPRLSSNKPTKKESRIIRFLYLGRFRDSTKGVLVLKSAIESIKDLDAHWHLDLVGGYGEQAKEIIEWANKCENVNYVGRWSSENICEKICNYDVCVVPSRFEGWNLLPYQALHAGVGCIVSDGAGSDLLVSSGKYGTVFKSNDVEALTEVLRNIISNPDVVSLWKQNALDYQKKINRESVGQYFLDCVAFAVGERQSKPICPWRNE